MALVYFRRDTHCFLLPFFFFVPCCLASGKFYDNPTHTAYIERMMDYNSVGAPIKNYLKCQGQIIGRLAKGDKRSYNTVLEFGCYNGYNCRFLDKEQIDYVGVDINYESFKKGFWGTKDRKNAIKLVSSATIFLRMPIPLNTLIIFPFNLFGNMNAQDQRYCLKKIASYKVDFVIFSYKINQKSNLVRRQYYEKIFQKKVAHKQTDVFSCFNCKIDDQTSFVSNAYTDGYWKKHLDPHLKNNYHITVGTFSGKVGLYRFYQHKRAQPLNTFVKDLSLFHMLKQSPLSLSNL